jgi:hypothetical protein
MSALSSPFLVFLEIFCSFVPACTAVESADRVGTCFPLLSTPQEAQRRRVLRRQTLRPLEKLSLVPSVPQIFLEAPRKHHRIRIIPSSWMVEHSVASRKVMTDSVHRDQSFGYVHRDGGAGGHDTHSRSERLARNAGQLAQNRRLISP